VDDELGQRGVERVVAERQLLGDRQADVDAGEPVAGRRDERLRRVDRGHLAGRGKGRQAGGERTGAAADVEHAGARGGAGERHERRRQGFRIAAHEPVIGVRDHLEAHDRDPRRSIQTTEPRGRSR
jgi:hypothetical protein